MFYVQVMIQPHNRHSSMSWYLAALAVVDTIVLAIGNFIIFLIIFDTGPSDSIDFMAYGGSLGRAGKTAGLSG